MADRLCDCAYHRTVNYSSMVLTSEKFIVQLSALPVFCGGQARHQRRRTYSTGKKNKDRLAGPAQQLEYM